MLAKAVHQLSGRKGELVAVNVAGLDDNMFSDTLFGHRKGAFTGADTNRDGFVENAIGGTLFLDEIGDLAMSSQVKLLRLLQDHRYYPLGPISPKTAMCALSAQPIAICLNEWRKGLSFGSLLPSVGTPD